MTTPLIQGIVTIDVIGPGYTDDPGDPATGKPYLQLTFSDNTVLCITAALADMVGGVGRGAIGRWEELRRGHSQ